MIFEKERANSILFSIKDIIIEFETYKNNNLL